MFLSVPLSSEDLTSSPTNDYGSDVAPTEIDSSSGTEKDHDDYSTCQVVASSDDETHDSNFQRAVGSKIDAA